MSERFGYVVIIPDRTWEKDAREMMPFHLRSAEYREARAGGPWLADVVVSMSREERWFSFEEFEAEFS